MKLNLKRPLVIFDLETTGLKVATARIVQISYIKLLPNGDEERRTYYVNPECHIPPETTTVHHITDAMVADKPTFRELAPMLKREFEGCDLAGFNSNHFDVPLLIEEMLRADIDFDWTRMRTIDVQNIFYKEEPRTLSAAYRFYCDRDLEGAHSADADTEATYKVLQAQLDRYDNLKPDVEFLADYSRMNRNVDPSGVMVRDAKGQIVFNIGKHKGLSVVEILEKKDPSYYSWMMQGDFALSTKRVLTQIKLGKLR